MILTAHSFLPSLAEIRLGWCLAVPRTRSVRDPGASHCARQFVLTVLAYALMDTFPDNFEADLEFDRTLIHRESILFSVSLLTPSGSISKS